MQLSVNIPFLRRDIEDILGGFSKLPSTIQKKYIGKAVVEVTKPHVQRVRSFTPRGPTGNLRRSVGVKVEKKKRNTTAMSVLGYRTRVGGSSREKGFHAWWLENGIADLRSPKGTVLAISTEFIDRYAYLNTALFDLHTTGGPYESLFFRRVRGFRGNGNFERWATATLPSIKANLQKTLSTQLPKAINEHRAKARKR
jgi:hypothetical protein